MLTVLLAYRELSSGGEGEGVRGRGEGLSFPLWWKRERDSMSGKERVDKI